jgi:superfamily II DNA or RNA helicase
MKREFKLNNKKSFYSMFSDNNYYTFDKNYKNEHPLWSFQKEAIEIFFTSIKYNRYIDMFVLQLPPGTGKTRIANQIVHKFIAKYPNRGVIWLSHKWYLLFQAASSLSRSFDLNELQSKIGKNPKGELQFLHSFENFPNNKRIFYSTERAFKNQIGKRGFPEILRKGKKPLVIIDECHYAIYGKSLPKIINYYRKGNVKSTILGLSATPKNSEKYNFKTFFERSYSDLSEYLAIPNIKDCQTNFKWAPTLIGHNKMISPSSLEELNDDERNNKIIDELRKGKKSRLYNKTIIFTCNISHADNIQELCRKNDFQSVIIHSQLGREEILESHNEFIKGKKDILINVNMYTHGVDIPDIDSVFIARPTKSEPLMLQMIGRGSRLTKNKKKFYITEFRDTILNGVELFNAKGFINTLFSSYSELIEKKTHISNAQKLIYHSELDNLPEFVKIDNEKFGDLDGISYAKDQTFGVEIEIASINEIPKYNSNLWHRKAIEIIDVLNNYASLDVKQNPGQYHSADIKKWSLEYDLSVGWEVVSPILKNEWGFEELKNVCVGLEQLTEKDDILYINYRCGLHVHLATRLNNNKKLKGLLRRIQRLEPGLFTILSPSRLYEYANYTYNIDKFNQYCLPVRNIDVDNISFNEFVDYHKNRYYTVNLTDAKQNNIHLLEIRMHNGTTDYRKIIPWISLWMYIFNYSRYYWEGESNKNPIFLDKNKKPLKKVEEEDIFQLLENDRIYIDAKLIELLKRRRNNLKDKWEKALPEKVLEWEKAGWYK